MNICIVSQRYPYKDNMEFVFVKKLVDEWAKMGHRCVVITSYSIVTQLRGRIQKKPVHYIDKVAEGVSVDVYNPRSLSIGHVSIGGVSVNSFISSHVIGRQIAKTGIKFDFIYCHFFAPALSAFPYAKKHNIPLFIATGESDIPNHKKPAFGFTWDEFRTLTKGVVAVSSKNKEEAASKNLIDKDKCKVFPNGTDLTLFIKKEKNECRKALSLPIDKFLVCCVGFFCERKGQNRVMAAINKLNNPNIQAIFLGKAAKINGLDLDGDNVAFKGSVKNTELPDYLNAADAFCLPTLHEGCCNAVIEAMACGSAIVSSDRPFNHDVLDSSNSILVDPENIDEIATAINKLYNDEILRKKLSEKVYADAQRLGIKQRSENILKFIQERM